jgi:hypothetical protein
MPIWALTLFGIAVVFIIIFIAGLICYLAGGRRSRQDLTNNIQSSIVEQPLLIENNLLQTTKIPSNKLIEKSRDGLF